MSFFSPRNRAEAGDRLAGMTGWAAALAALVYALNVVQALTGPPMSNYLNDAGLIGSLLIVLVFLPSFFIIKRRLGGPPVNPWKEDGFMSQAIRRAALTGFATTFLAMSVLTMLDGLVLERIAADVLLDLVLTIALASFALSFFLFSRDSDPGETL
ncbi:hypothetical protein [Maricaulis sp.]|uniref:hypothetical protein n=1 Tax=Maricaulis sp. TaxID=1486257 RepID=UPI0025BD29B8|nr:hypothetical protein [Maricaulis sp.]